MSNSITGTPWHISYGDRIKENDERRHKSKCKYYNKETKKCNKYLSVCFGSSHCKYYDDSKEDTEEEKINMRGIIRIHSNGKFSKFPYTSYYKNIKNIEFINDKYNNQNLLSSLKIYLTTAQLNIILDKKAYPKAKGIVKILKNEFNIEIEKENCTKIIYDAIMLSKVKDEESKITIDIEKFINCFTKSTKENKLTDKKQDYKPSIEYKENFMNIQNEDEQQNEHVKNVLVSRKMIEWIAYNFKISDHAKFKIVEKDSTLDRDFKQAILNSPLAWKNGNDTLAIAIDLYNYIIVSFDRNGVNPPKILTFETTKDYKTSVIEKMFVDYKDYMKNSK